MCSSEHETAPLPCLDDNLAQITTSQCRPNRSKPPRLKPFNRGNPIVVVPNHPGLVGVIQQDEYMPSGALLTQPFITCFR